MNKSSHTTNKRINIHHIMETINAKQNKVHHHDCGAYWEVIVHIPKTDIESTLSYILPFPDACDTPILPESNTSSPPNHFLPPHHVR